MFSLKRWSLILGIGIWIGILITVVLVATLMGASGGEVAAALAGIIGGGIGAAGSALAVYMALDLQRKDEAEKVGHAILTEIAELSRFAIGHLGACELIQAGAVQAPKSELPRLMASPHPVVYPAVADRLSRLARPSLVVSFYTRLEEMRNVVDVIAFSPPPSEIMGPGHIQQLADILISICQIAKFILAAPESDSEHEKALASAVRKRTTEMMDEQLVHTKTAFPNAESWTIHLE